jgi:chromosome partitioning protein
VLIIDTAGFGNQAAAVAIAGADLVLVPVTPGEADLIEAQRTVAYVGGLARSTRRAIPVRVVANRIRRQTTLSRHVLAELDRLGLPRLQTIISEAVAYGELTFAGTLPVGPVAEETAALTAILNSGLRIFLGVSAPCSGGLNAGRWGSVVRVAAPPPRRWTGAGEASP